MSCVARSLTTPTSAIRAGIPPGVFDMISARIADCMGFDALYMTGYGATASYLGLPDASIGRVFVLFPDPWPKERHE